MNLKMQVGVSSVSLDIIKKYYCKKYEIDNYSQQ